MPLLLVTGFPACGKSVIVDRIAAHFIGHGKKVQIIRDDDYALFSRGHYNQADKEKDFRSHLRSLVQKHLTKDTVVICDGLNYIKGFRYELFLVGKLVQTTYAVLQIEAPKSVCLWLNSEKQEDCRYPEQKIADLIQRYEKPDARQRWDSPLYQVQVGRLEGAAQESDDMHVDLEKPSPKYTPLPSEELFDWLINGVSLTENKSTATAPLAPTNFLHELDRATQEVVQYIIGAQRTSVPGQDIVVPSAPENKNKVKFVKIRTLPELSRLRRQFINFSKMHPIDNKSTIASLFVDYLNSNV